MHNKASVELFREQLSRLTGADPAQFDTEGKKREHCSAHPQALLDVGNFPLQMCGRLYYHAALSLLSSSTSFQLQFLSMSAMNILNHCFPLKFCISLDFSGLQLEPFGLPGERFNKLPIGELSISAMVECFVLFCFLEKCKQRTKCILYFLHFCLSICHLEQKAKLQHSKINWSYIVMLPVVKRLFLCSFSL